MGRVTLGLLLPVSDVCGLPQTVAPPVQRVVELLGAARRLRPGGKVQEVGDGRDEKPVEEEATGQFVVFPDS